jgi:hypothetical protein
MTDDTPSDSLENCSADHQQAVEACEHALDALHDDNHSHAHRLLDEARVAVERVQHDESDQLYRKTAYDCYD